MLVIKDIEKHSVSHYLMKKLILISVLLLSSNAWAKEQGLECVRHAQIGDTTFTFYNDYIINEDEEYILIYPTYVDANVVKYPPETDFKKHPIKLSPVVTWIYWTTIIDGEEVNYRFIRDDLHLIEYFPQYDNVLDGIFMDKDTIMSNIRMRTVKEDE